MQYNDSKQHKEQNNNNSEEMSSIGVQKINSYSYNTKIGNILPSYHSNSSKLSVQSSHTLITPLNVHLANSLLSTGTSSSNPSLFSHSVSNLVSAGAYTSAAVQKSLSSLDVKNMTRDISLNQDNFIMEESWPALVIRVLPLFNGERLAGKIEDLNESVRNCLKNTDLVKFSNDINQDLLSAGMFTLNAKLAGIHEDKVANRVVELWSFFLGTVLPYLEGVFLPHQIEINSLKRSSLTSVRTMALNNFKIHVIAPFMDKLESAIHQLFKEEVKVVGYNKELAAKLLQMMSILNMTPTLQDDKLQEQFNLISNLLKKHWKQSLFQTHK